VVLDFESWFSSLPKAQVHPSIRHDFFGSLRGLAWTTGNSDHLPPKPVVSVPLSVVLQSDMDEDNHWDAELAVQLWIECQKGAQSQMSGYCQFLMQGYDANSERSIPPSTAPDALRHWTDEELAALQTTTAGQKLIQLNVEQQEKWRLKYNQVNNNNNNNMTLEQFQWAMEVVHSRAFKGNFGISTTSTKDDSNLVSTVLPTLLPPLGAAIAGYAYLQMNPLFPDDKVLAVLALVAALPLVLNVLKTSSNPPSAVLLPMIDSANHKEDADSSIEYDPLSGCFQMSIGPKCLIPSTKDQLQLCISYGKRSDAELLLNYGFVPGVSSEKEPTEIHRKRLAEAFVARNSS